MYTYPLHQTLNQLLKDASLDIAGQDNSFYIRFMANVAGIKRLYDELYGEHPAATPAFNQLLQAVMKAHTSRQKQLRKRDAEKEQNDYWFLSNQLCGMSLYVDRFCGNLENLSGKLDYFEQLGVNLLHLMPLFESPAEASDGGYAVSDFRKIEPRFGTLSQLRALQKKMQKKKMYLMLDIVLNHTSNQHAWARKARQGDKHYQDYFHFFPDRSLPDAFEQTLPEIFPESSPGNFTYVPECRQWVMTVFHNYQWDLNYANPLLLVEMLDTVLFYGNLGVDILRIDAPAFIWKQPGTTCQNLPQAHTILRLLKACVQVAMPGMALLGEAIVAPQEIMKYFGTGPYTARECDFAYNATQMALQWDALATNDTRIMRAAQSQLYAKPFGTSWITYTRCHDDIGLGYPDALIEAAGYNAYWHKKFLQEYYAGSFPGSPARGALFGVNPKTQDARISGTLASLCGLESAWQENNAAAVEQAVNRMILMQAQGFFLGGIPMLFYGDEVGYTNDYSYLREAGKSYDNRWMHRPWIDWQRNDRRSLAGSIENRVFSATQRLIRLRRKLAIVADKKNPEWLETRNDHVAGYLRTSGDRRLYCLFNFGGETSQVTWYVFKEHGPPPAKLQEHWQDQCHSVGDDHAYLALAPYGFGLFEPIR